MSDEEWLNFARKKVDLSTVNFTPELIASVPRNLVLKYRCLAVSRDANCLCLAVKNPRDLDIIDSLHHFLKRDLEFRTADEVQLDAFIKQLYDSGRDKDK